jgi:hypothetical protein
MRTRHHNRTRIRIGDGHSIDNELFAAAIAAKMTSPYSRHIKVIYEFRSKISIRCLPGECVTPGFDLPGMAAGRKTVSDEGMGEKEFQRA